MQGIVSHLAASETDGSAECIADTRAGRSPERHSGTVISCSSHYRVVFTLLALL